MNENALIVDDVTNSKVTDEVVLNRNSGEQNTNYQQEQKIP